MPKGNEPSLAVHRKAGFRIVSETGINYLDGTENDRTFGLEYAWSTSGDLFSGTP